MGKKGLPRLDRWTSDYRSPAMNKAAMELSDPVNPTTVLRQEVDGLRARVARLENRVLELARGEGNND